MAIKLSRQETPKSVGGQKDTAILVVMMMMMMRIRTRTRTMMTMTMTMTMMMMMDDMTRWMSRMRRKMKMMILRRKTDPKTGKHTLCEHAQSKCTWTFEKSHVVWKFTGKLPGTPPGTVFCASLCSRSAHGHFRRAVLYGNLQEKCWTPFSVVTLFGEK